MISPEPPDPDPSYQARQRASSATEGKVDNFCTGCHTPIGLTTGQINSEVNRSSIEDSAKNHHCQSPDCGMHGIGARDFVPALPCF